MKKEDLKTIIKLIITVLIIVIIGIIIYLQTPLPKAYRRVNKFNNMTEYKKGTVILNNTQEWSNDYKGTVDILTVNATIDFFAKKLVPEYRAIEDVQSYYNSNKKVIEVYTGINNFDDFANLVKRAKELKGDDLELERAEYTKGSSRISRREVHAVLALQYKGNDKILFNVVIKFTPDNNSSSVLFDANVDETLFDTTRHDIVIPEVDPSKHTGRVM